MTAGFLDARCSVQPLTARLALFDCVACPLLLRMPHNVSGRLDGEQLRRHGAMTALSLHQRKKPSEAGIARPGQGQRKAWHLEPPGGCCEVFERRANDFQAPCAQDEDDDAESDEDIPLLLVLMS